MHFILSTLSTLSTVSAQSWLRRAYFDDTRCAGSMSVGISVPATYSCSQTTPLINTCEVKGQDPYKTGDLKSSEATGCTPRNGPVSDAAWVPSANEGRLSPGASYMTVNAYVDTSCTPSALSEQNIFLADGRCYAVEFEKSFFRATCEGNAGTLSVFTDPLCQSCDGGHLFAGMYQVTSISGNDACVVPSGGLAYKIICGVPGGGGGGASPAPGIVCPVSSPGSRSLTTNGAVTTSSVSSTTGEISASSTKSNTTPSTLNGASTDNQRQAASVIGVAGLAAMLL